MRRLELVDWSMTPSPRSSCCCWCVMTVLAMRSLSRRHESRAAQSAATHLYLCDISPEVLLHGDAGWLRSGIALHVFHSVCAGVVWARHYSRRCSCCGSSSCLVMGKHILQSVSCCFRQSWLRGCERLDAMAPGRGYAIRCIGDNIVQKNRAVQR